MSRSGENINNDAEDTRLEALLLQRLLDLHPTRVTVDELVRDLADGDDFGARDGIERAIVELTRSGLVHPVTGDGFVDPTRPAVRLGELLGSLA